MGRDKRSAHHPNWKEQRSWRALELNRDGWTHEEVAEALGVTKGAVSQWMKRVAEDGEAALRARPHQGATPKLTADQKQMLPDSLAHGAEAYGFRGEFWNSARVREVIRREFEVTYHKNHIPRLLHDLGWTPQQPAERAGQRDEPRIARWRSEVWPALGQKARRERRTPVLIDEAAFYLLPGTVRTWAPCGRRPVLRCLKSHDHLSMMSGITPGGEFYTLTRDYPLTGWESILFLCHLRRRLGTDLLAIWDGSPIHRSADIKSFLAQGGARFVWLEQLPPYAPDLNPDERVWQHLKHVELRNLCCHDLAHLSAEVKLAVNRLRRKPALIQSFFEGAGLKL